MKKVSSIVAVCALLVTAVGCATTYPRGSLYTDVGLPVNATSNGQGSKVGTASATSILGLIATGDATIEAAKQNGNISEVTHVDWDAHSILGIIGTYTVTVYGN